MKDLGRLNIFSALNCSELFRPLFESKEYALEIVAETSLLGAKLASTPLEPNHQLAKSIAPLFNHVDWYHRLIGELIYLTLTHLDFSYAVHILAQFMHSPRKERWEAAFRVVRYLKGCPDQRILLSSTFPIFSTAYYESDWAICPLTRRSATRYFVS